MIPPAPSKRSVAPTRSGATAWTLRSKNSLGRRAGRGMGAALGSRNQAQDQRIIGARRAATGRVQPCPTLADDDDGQAEIKMDGTTYSALGQPGVGFFMAIIIGALA